MLILPFQPCLCQLLSYTCFPDLFLFAAPTPATLPAETLAPHPPHYLTLHHSEMATSCVDEVLRADPCLRCSLTQVSPREGKPDGRGSGIATFPRRPPLPWGRGCGLTALLHPDPPPTPTVRVVRTRCPRGTLPFPATHADRKVLPARWAPPEARSGPGAQGPPLGASSPAGRVPRSPPPEPQSGSDPVGLGSTRGPSDFATGSTPVQSRLGPAPNFAPARPRPRALALGRHFAAGHAG